MEPWEELRMDVTVFETEDVITASSGEGIQLPVGP